MADQNEIQDLQDEQASKGEEKPKQPPAPLKREDHEYEIYAPPNSYDTKIKAGSVKLLVLEANPEGSRHDDLVAHIARLSSEKMARSLNAERPQIFVRGGSPMENIPLLQQADIVNFSAGLRTENFFGVMYSSASDPGEKFDKLKKPIFVQAVGNHGNSPDRGEPGSFNHGIFDQPTSDDIQFYRHSIKVGEVTRGPDGRIIIDEHSARAGPSLLAFNPTEQGVKFLYYPDLTKLTPEQRKNVTIDSDGYVSNIQGTSFATPVVSGSLGAAKDAYSNLSNSELIATALASGRIPPEYIKESEVHRTAAGLYFGDYKYGYGVFDPDLFKKNLEIMNDVRRKHGPSKDTEVTQTAFTPGRLERDGISYNVHKFNIPQNITAEKITLFANMPLRTLPPSEFVVISPSGREVHVPASVGAGTARFTTEAFLGENTKGEWTILTSIVPGMESGNRRIAQDGERIDKSQPGATFTISGQELDKNGRSTISMFLERATQEPAPAPVPPAVKAQEPEQGFNMASASPATRPTAP